MEEQTNLLELPEMPPVQGEDGASAGKVIPKLRTVNRAQMMMANISVEELIPADHKARAIWELAGRLQLDRFEESVKTQAGNAGRPAWDPRLLVSVWVYAYSEGIGSAREVARRCEFDPAFDSKSRKLGTLYVNARKPLAAYRFARAAAAADIAG